jgi:hypothetical protein
MLRVLRKRRAAVVKHPAVQAVLAASRMPRSRLFGRERTASLENTLASAPRTGVFKRPKTGGATDAATHRHYM